MKSTFNAAAALLATVSLASAQSNAPKCDPQNLCPQDTPCCSQYGQCGVGAYCLGGCDPVSSFDLQSCMAAPVCQSKDIKMTSLDDVSANTVYLGDASNVDWVSSGKPVTYSGDSILLTMAPSTVGTLLTSTHYVWFGKVCATMTTSRGQGVVTAFILMSDVKDEIDFEFVGDDVTSAQSNYYWQGVTDYHNMIPLDVSNTQENTHEYCIDWSPQSITWSIDGNDMRTLKQSDTWNDTDNTFHYPQTPARVQLSLWPAGLPSNGEGTITWAGGLVNWDSSNMQNGYYYAMVKDVTVECYDPPSGFSNDFGDKAYYYTSRVGTNNTVAIGNNNTVLSSFLASGDNADYNPNAPKPSASGSKSSAPAAPTNAQTVPGISGGGNAASSGENPATGQGSGSSSGAGGLSNGGSSVAGNSGSGGFSQGTNAESSTSGASQAGAGSAIALLGFFVAALLM